MPQTHRFITCAYKTFYLHQTGIKNIHVLTDTNPNHPKSIITKTYLYNFDPLKPHFHIVKLGFTGVYIIYLIFAKKHRLWVLVRTASARQL